MKIREVATNKKDFIDLLLLADEQESMIDGYLERGRLFVLEGDEPVGVCLVTDEGDSVLEIKNLAISLDYQGQGYGKQLLHYIEEKFQDMFETVRVGTGDSPVTVGFYEACGFVQADKLRDFFINHYDHPIFEKGKQLVDMIILEKSLNAKTTSRCSWATHSSLEEDYHDKEWGKPTHDERELYEFLLLESMQAGLSWYTVLVKRQAFSDAFDQFDYQKIATYGQEKVAQLLDNPGIIRNRLKIGAAISNAAAFMKIQEEFGSFDAYIWSFVENKPIVNHWHSMDQVPAKTPLAETISKKLKQRGFKFVGPTIIYSYMQAIGMVNDHLVSCPFK